MSAGQAGCWEEEASIPPPHPLRMPCIVSRRSRNIAQITAKLAKGSGNTLHGPIAMARTIRTKTNQALIARHFVEHNREGFARAWLRTQELSWAADLLKD